MIHNKTNLNFPKVQTFSYWSSNKEENFVYLHPLPLIGFSYATGSQLFLNQFGTNFNYRVFQK